MGLIRFDFHDVSPEALGESDAIRQACECFVKQGYVVLDRVVSEAQIAVLRVELEAEYPDYLLDRELADSLMVGERRYMFPLKLRGAFADPAIFANPFIMAVVRRVLQDDVALEAFGLINSMDGAGAQHAHRDGPPLFASDISAILPAHALTCALPLVSMDKTHGTTAIWPGSHRLREHDPSVPPLEPGIPAGSCLLWDFRLFHSGTANRSRRRRPMLYSTYARRWYQDPVNFTKSSLPRLVFEHDFVAGLSADARRLFPPVD